jgi:hypothetical protein
VGKNKNQKQPKTVFFSKLLKINNLKEANEKIYEKTYHISFFDNFVPIIG